MTFFVYPPTRARRSRAVIPLAVAAVAVGLATLQYARFLPAARDLWTGLVHDRNGHYGYALDLAIAFRRGDVVGLLSHIEKAKVWPPLHGLTLAPILAVFGPDYRLAVLPSLVGFAMTIVFAFQLAREAAGGGVAGMLAGALTLVWIASSPAHRWYATDVMLESLGAGLTVLSLYLYARAARDGSSPRDWRRLAVALTLLFFERYNYWAIVVSAIAADRIAARFGEVRRALGALRGKGLVGSLVREAVHPLALAAVLVAGVAAWIARRGPTSITIGGHDVSFYPPYNLLAVAWALVLARVGMAVRRHPRFALEHLGTAAREMIRWHALPVAVSFLLPRRLGFFLWLIGPTSAPAGGLGTLDAAAFYVRVLAVDYHSAAWSAMLATVLAVVGAVAMAGRGAAPWLILVGAVAVLVHPNRSGRFLHPSVAALWITAAIGAAVILRRGSRVLPRLARPWAAAAVVVVAIAHATTVRAPRPFQASSTLTLVETYLPHLHDARRTAVLATLPCWSLVRWTYAERYPERYPSGLEIPLAFASASVGELSARVAAWARSTTADTVVLIDVPRTSPHFVSVGWDPDVHRALSQLLDAETIFVPSGRWVRDGVTIRIWRRVAARARPERSSR